MKRQDDLTRRRRLNDGRCPTHGTALTQIGIWTENNGKAGPVVGCPRKDCNFKVDVKPGTKLYELLCKEPS